MLALLWNEVLSLNISPSSFFWSESDLVISQLYRVYTTHVPACGCLHWKHVNLHPHPETALYQNNCYKIFFIFFLKSQKEAGKNNCVTWVEVFDLIEVWLTWLVWHLRISFPSCLSPAITPKTVAATWIKLEPAE